MWKYAKNQQFLQHNTELSYKNASTIRILIFLLMKEEILVKKAKV